MKEISHPRRPLVIAHRGASLEAPENSVAAIERASSLGADWVEVDVRMAVDETLVLVHDEMVETVLVSDSSLAELRSVRADIATLREGLGAAGRIGVNLELKPPFPDPERFASLVATEVRDHPGSIMFSSFWWPILGFVSQVMDRAQIGVLSGHLFDEDGREAIAHAIERGYRTILPEDPAVTSDLVGEAHNAGLKIIAWTVDSSRRIEELATWGVDGIITNDPRRALSLLGPG